MTEHASFPPGRPRNLRNQSHPNRQHIAGIRPVGGVPVAESAVAPPGPIPNPVVTHRSAGEYCGGDPVGGEAAAGPPDRLGRQCGIKKSQKTAVHCARPFCYSEYPFSQQYSFEFATTSESEPLLQAIYPHVFDADMVRVVDSFACVR